jgi:hypothetical protein
LIKSNIIQPQLSKSRGCPRSPDNGIFVSLRQCFKGEAPLYKRDRLLRTLDNPPEAILHLGIEVENEGLYVSKKEYLLKEGKNDGKKAKNNR